MISKAIEAAAKRENIGSLVLFAENFFTGAGCPKKIITNFCIAIDEAAANICSYAYPENKSGIMGLKCEFCSETKKYSVLISDSGVRFDPLAFPAANISAGASERAVGGLGIHIIRTLMDETSYTYRNGCNILKLTQSIK